MVEALESVRRVGESCPPLADTEAREKEGRADEQEPELRARVEHDTPSVP